MPTRATPDDAQLLGAEISIGRTVIGRVEGLVRDPLSQRVRRLITTYGPASYGPARRRVGVPMEWVAKHSASGVVLGVASLSLDDLHELAPSASGPAHQPSTSRTQADR